MRAPNRPPRRYMDPVVAAERLGIQRQHLDTFVAMVDMMRVADAIPDELQQARAELAQVDEELHKAGIMYPGGARGVRDLRAMSEADDD